MKGWNEEGKHVTYMPQGSEGMMKTAVILRKYQNGGKHFCDIRLLNGREVKMVAELFVRPSTQPYVRRPGVVSKSVVNEEVEIEKVLKECG